MSAFEIEPVEDAILDALAPVNPDAGDSEARFHIVDKGGADWAARIVMKARAARDEDEALAAVQISAIKKWLGRSAERCERIEERWLPELIEWHASQRNTDHKGRTVNATIELPSGAKLVSRQGQIGVKVHDVDAFVEWAQADDAIGQGLLRRVPAKVEPDAAAIKKYLTPAVADGEPGPWVLDGEVVPGLIAQPAAVRYSLDTPKSDA